MNGRNLTLLRKSTCGIAAGLLITLVFLLAGHAAEENAGVRGIPGHARNEGTLNFSQAAEAEKKSNPSARATRVERPRSKPSRIKPASLRSGSSESTNSLSTATAASEFTFTPASAPPSPPPSASFAGLIDDATSFTPDSQGALGTNHIVTMLASQVKIQTRAGAVLSTVSLGAFWGTANVYDPRLLYDPLSQRWIACAVAGANTDWSLLIAASQTSDPTGNWFRHSVPVANPSPSFVESPNMGFSRDWVIVQLNSFDFASGYFTNSQIRAFNKAALYAGSGAPFTSFKDTNALSEVNTAIPSVNLDNSFPTNFLVANWIGDSDGFGFLRLYSISGTVGNEVFRDYETNGLYVTGGVSGNLPWDDFWPQYTNFAPQLGTTDKVYLGDARIQNVVFRNSTLWCTHHVYLPAGGSPTRTAIQWWALTPGATVLQRGRLDDASNTRFYAYPSIAVNSDEDVLIGYSRFAGNQFPSANYAFHGFEDSAGELRADTVLKPGEDNFSVLDQNSLNRWGDWSATVVDPNNDTDLWTLQEYASTAFGGTDRWGTWWGRVSPPASLTLTATAAPDSVVAGNNVTYSIRMTNNFPTLATGARVVSTLPLGAVLVSATSPQGACTLTNGVVTCNYGDLAGNASVTATIVAQLNQGPATNTITALAYGPDEDNPADNTVRIITPVQSAADLTVSVSANPSSVVTVSNVLTYVASVTNRGPSPALSVFLTNRLPAGITYISAASSGQGTCSHNSGVVICNLGSLSGGVGLNITIQARPTSPGTLSNRTDVVTTSFDPISSNNSTSMVHRANASPVLQPMSPRTILEDTTLGPINFTVSDLETPGNNLVVNTTSSNPGLVANTNIIITFVSANTRALTVTPSPNAFGNTLITTILTDGDGATATNSFLLTVQDQNDSPTISDIQNVSTNEDFVVGPISFTVGDVETPNGLSLSGASSLTTLIPNSNIRFETNGALRTVTLTPLPNQFGSATITVTVSDGQASTIDTFVVTINSVNDLPTISDITNRVVSEDAMIGPIQFTVGDIETTPALLTPDRISSNPTLIPEANIVFGGAGVNRNVTITPATNQFGTATITISITDTNGGVTNDTFVVTVNPVNDPPTLNTINPITIAEDAGLQTIQLSGISPGALNEAQTNLIIASSSNPGLIPDPTVAYNAPDATGSLSFTPVSNSNGTATITVTVNDQGASNSVLIRTFDVTVTAVNDPPTLSDIIDRSVNEDTATGQIAFTAADIDSPLASITAFGISSNPTLVPNSSIQVNGSGGNWTVNVLPATNQFGTATITVFVTDGSATNSDFFVLTVQSVNDLPAISSFGPATLNEDTQTNISFTISDAETAAANLNLNATSSNPGLFTSLTFGGSGNARTLQVVPAPNASGLAMITVAVSDAELGTNFASFSLQVVAVNDPPTLNPLDDLTISEDAPQQNIPITGLGAGAPDENQTLQVTVTSDRPALFSTLQVSHNGTSATGSLLLTPAANSNGVATVTVSVSDGAATNTDSFLVTITPLNDPPSISTILDRTTLEDVTAVIEFTVSDPESAPSLLNIEVDSSNPELLDSSGISVEGTGNTRTLRLTPLEDQSGSSTFVTVTVRDPSNETGSTSFELTVQSVNDLPSITGLTNITIPASQPVPSVPFTVNDPETPPSSLILEATSSNQALLPNANISITGTTVSRTLHMTPVAGRLGSTTVQIIVRDGPGVGAESATNTFVLSLVNDPPTLNVLNPISVNEDSASVNVVLSGISSGAPNDNQVVTVTATSSNPNLVPDPTVSYVNPATTGELTLAPRANSNGTATITVTVSDGETINGTFSRQFTFTVNSIDDPPTISAVEDQTSNEDVQVAFTVGITDIDTPQENLQLLSFSSNTNLVPTNRIAFSGTTGTRTVTISPATNAFGTAQISLFVRDQGGNVASNAFVLTVLPVSDPPVITDIANTNVNEDQQLAISFTIGDPESTAAELALVAASSNPGLLSPSGIQFGGTDSNRTVTLIPTANQTGSVTVTVTVVDPFGMEASDSFVLTVSTVNDPPTLVGLPNITINEDSSSGPLPVTVGDAETALNSLNLTASSSNAGLVPNSSVTPGGTGANRTVVITPLPDQSGTTTITLALSDGAGGSTNAQFTLTVLPVNDPPALNFVNNVTLSEDAGLQTVPLSGISGGSGESQSVTIIATSSNPGLIPNPTVNHNGVNATGSLTFTPVSNVTGTAIITVTVNDGQAANNLVTRTFTVTVNAANDTPTISDIANQTINEDTVLETTFTIGDAETPAVNLTLIATSTNTTLVPGTNIVFNGTGATRQLTIVPTTNLSGTTLITVRVSDGVATNTDTFLLTVNAVNDPPVFNPIPHYQTNSAGGNPAHTITLSGISAGGTNESQSLSFTSITSSNTALLPNPTVAYTSPSSTATLTLRPANAQGNSLVTVVLSDGSLTATQTFLVSIKSSVNVRPTISVVGAQTLAEDIPSSAVSFSVRDAETTASSLTLLAHSSNPALLPTNNIAFANGPTNRTMTLTPQPNQSGTAVITLTVLDTQFGSSNMAFNVTVNPVNDLPSVSPIATQTISEDASAAAVPFDVSDVETLPGNLTVIATSANQSLIPNSALVVGGSGTNRILSITPAANQFGSTTVTINVSDGAGNTNRTFTVTVNSGNDAPTISDVADQSVLEDTPTTAIAFSVNDTETAAAGLAVTASSSNTNLFPASSFVFGPTTTSNRTVTITPATNQFGSATVSLTVTDGTNQTLDTFELVVLPVNDAPTLDTIGNRNVPQGGSLQTVNLTGITSGAANEVQTLLVSASSSNPGLIPHPTVVYTSPNSSGSLTFTPVANASGSATITVTVNDAQSTNSSVLRTFTVSVNSAPTISAVANRVINEDTTSPAIPFTVADTESAPASIQATARSSNQTLVPDQNLTVVADAGGSRTLTITPVANQSGFATITLRAVDTDGSITESSFLLTVVPVNDTPTMDTLANRTVMRDAGPQVVDVTGISAGPNEVQALTLTAVSSNPSLIPNPVVNYSSPGSSAALTFTPAAGATGAVTITVTLTDDGGLAFGGSNRFSRTFDVSVGVARPSLRIQPSGKNVIVSWPTTDGPDWTLFTTTSLLSSNWNVIMRAPVVVNGRYTITNSAIGNQFYRLEMGGNPALWIVPSGTNVVVSWPANAPGNWQLFGSTNLTSWNPIPQAPAVVNGRRTVTNAATSRLLYRLHKTP